MTVLERMAEWISTKGDEALSKSESLAAFAADVRLRTSTISALVVRFQR